MKNAKYTAHQIAEWFMNWAASDEDEGSSDIDNLKMQKILYYADGHYLARKGSPLFGEAIEAWAHGPVVPEIYREMKYGKPQPIVANDDYKWNVIDGETSKFLAGIWDAYGQYSSWKLRNMTHATAPWRDKFDPDIKNNPIENDAIRKYFISVEAQ